MTKSWLAQEYYNEYLDLKLKIKDATIEYTYCAERPRYNEMADIYQKELIEYTARLRIVLHELKNNGVDMTDLVLLSAGVDIVLFE